MKRLFNKVGSPGKVRICSRRTGLRRAGGRQAGLGFSSSDSYRIYKRTPVVNLHFREIVLGLIAAALLAFVSTGCKNTAHGAGKDIENMGEKIQEKTN